MFKIQVEDCFDEHGKPHCYTGRMSRILQTLECIDNNHKLSAPVINTSAVCQEIYSKVSAMKDKSEAEI